MDFAGYFKPRTGFHDRPGEGRTAARATPDGLTVNEVGRLFIRNIAMRFDRYLPAAKERRFSKTI